MAILVISTSLNPGSLSRIMARVAHQQLVSLDSKSAFVDIKELSLPVCDGADAYDDPASLRLAEAIESAQGILMALPIYNYAGSAAAKNVIELTGSSWNHKVVGFLCAAGGKSSYMSVMTLANSLMLDFRAFILPQFVYAQELDFTENHLVDETTELRIRELARLIHRIAPAVADTMRQLHDTP